MTRKKDKKKKNQQKGTNKLYISAAYWVAGTQMRDRWSLPEQHSLGVERAGRERLILCKTGNAWKLQLDKEIRGLGD